MALYLMTVHGAGEIDEFANYGSSEDMERALARTEVFNQTLREKGFWVFAGGLQSVSTAIVVDGQGQATATTDGPYLETKEYLAGFWIVDVPDRDLAVEVAAGASRACGCKVELRPFDALSSDTLATGGSER